MLKALVDKYTVSNEDAEDDEKPLDGVEETEEVEDTERENETQEEQSDTAEEEEADDTDEDLATEEAAGDTTVLEAPTDEQGEVSTADTEEVVSEIEPEADVTEAGDDVGQATPDEAFDGTTDQADITVGSDSAGPAPTDTAAVDAAAVENTIKEGEEVAQGQADIIQQAEATASEIENGGDAAGADSDVNGNSITPEEVAENEHEEEVAAEIDAENDEEVTATDVVAEETPLEEAEALADELSDDVSDDAEESTDDALGEDSADSGIDGSDTGGDDFGGGETSTDGSSDDFDDDDVPLEGAEVASDVADSEVSEESTDGTDEATGDAALPEGDTPDTEVTEGDTDSVQDSVDDQNAAADVTAEAASSDVNDTAAIKGEDVAQDDDEIPLDVDVDDSFKQKEVDGNPSYSDNAQDDTAATVQETIDNPDGTEESLAKDISDDAASDNEEMTAAIDETEGEDATDAVDADAEIDESQSEIDPTTDATDGIDDVEQESQIGDEGEIEDTNDADFAEGEVDIPDVDTEVTDDDVAVAEVAAADEEVRADKDEQLAADAQKTVEELQEEAKGLEAFIQRLEEGISNESYNAATIVQGYPMLDKHKLMWGEGDTPSLEDYGPKDLDLLYVASLESARGFLSRTLQLSTRLRDQLLKWWERPMVTKIVKRADAIQKSADKALMGLKDSPFNGGEVKGISGYLSTNKDGLVRAVADDLKYTTAIATRGLSGNESLVHSIVKALDDITTAKTPAVIKQALTASKNIKSSKSNYPQEAFTKGALMGNWKLEMKDGSIGTSGIPVAVKETSGDRKTSFNLTKADLGNFIVMAKTYAAIAKKAAETIGDTAVEEYPSFQHARARALPMKDIGRIQGDWGDEKEIDALAEDMLKVSKAHHDAYKFIVKHALDMAEALVAVVNKAA